MADRTSAGAFGNIFDILAKNLDALPINVRADRIALAKEIWTEHNNYDFTDDQMDVDDSLLALELVESCKICKGIIYSKQDRRDYHGKGKCD